MNLIGVLQRRKHGFVTAGPEIPFVSRNRGRQLRRGVVCHLAELAEEFGGVGYGVVETLATIYARVRWSECRCGK
jgi:hypothetical protein